MANQAKKAVAKTEVAPQPTITQKVKVEPAKPSWEIKDRTYI